MNVLKNIENIVRVKEELYEMQKKTEHLRREIDNNIGEIIEFLKWKELIRVKK
jgi:hypothetical protein